MRYGNLHTHTVFSDGQHTLDENCRSALRLGMTYLGFSEHAYGPSDLSWTMAPDGLPAYLREAARLKAEYADRIPIYVGLEIDDQSCPVDAELDFVLGGIHSLRLACGYYSVDGSPTEQKTCIDEAFGGNAVDFAKCYFDHLVAFIQRQKPTYVAHFDLATKFGFIPEEDPIYRDHAIEAMEEIIRHCPYIELNTGAISRGWRTDPYPNRFLLDTVRKQGGKLVLGSDSHHKDNLIFEFDRCVTIAKAASFDTLYAFNGKSFDPISI